MADKAAAAQWQTRGEFDAELHHLPRTSVVEFRSAAWKLWSHETLWPGNGWYLPAVGLRGFLAIMLALVPISFVIWVPATGDRVTADEVLLAVASAILSVLLGWWKLRSNRRVIRRRRRNKQLAEMSREIDELVERGHIPHAPAGWAGRTPAPLE